MAAPSISRQAIELASLALLVAFGIGCNDRAPVGERRVGVIEFYGDTAEISIPDVGTVGEYITIGVHTFGNNCVSKDHTRNNVDQNVVTVTPHDAYVVGAACSDAVTFVDHTTWHLAERAGYITIVIRGRVEPGGQIKEKTYTVLVEE